VLRETDEEAWRAQALAEIEFEQYHCALLLREPPLSELEQHRLLLDFARRRCKEALREEDTAARVEAKFARTAPLAPNEDIEPSDAVAMSAAFKRRREATAIRQAWSSKYHDLLVQSDPRAGDTSTNTTQ
jgi:thioesterase domain-containing protein